MLVKILNSTHPDYDGARLTRLRALIEGGSLWHALKEQLFPKRAVEPSSIYSERKQLLAYTNHAGTVLGLLGALLFAEPPTLEGLTGDYWTALWANSDGAGTPWRRFWRERFQDAQVGQQSFIWVNLPARHPEAPEPANRAEEEQAGYLDAYLVRLQPEQVIDWGEDTRGKLSWVMFRSVTEERPSIEQPRQKKWQWTYIDATVIRRWEWTPPADKDQNEPRPDDEATELDAIEHQLGQLPVVRLTLPTELWAGGKLEDPAVAATRARNEHSWALHQAANELLVVTSTWGDEQIVLGHGHYLKLGRDKTGADTAQYIAPSGVAFQYLQEDVASTRDEVYRVVQQMALSADADAARQRMSGESKAMDWKASEIVLASYADIIRGAMAEVVKLLAAIRGEDTAELNLTGLDGWQDEDMLAFLKAAAQSTDARRLSPTFVRTIAKRQVTRLLQDEVDEKTLAVILKEIDEAPDDKVTPPAPPASPNPDNKPTGSDNTDDDTDDDPSDDDDNND